MIDGWGICVKYFTDQMESITVNWISRSHIPIEMGPLRFETVGEVVNFALIHEAILQKRAGDRKTLLFFAAET